jgi:hypothetical protein
VCGGIQAGFCDLQRVQSFGLFNDTSTLQYKGVGISLNVIATACKEGPRIDVNLARPASRPEPKPKAKRRKKSKAL